MDVKRVNAAVKIKISKDRYKKQGSLQNKEKLLSLDDDLSRLLESMTNEEYNEYVKRIR